VIGFLLGLFVGAPLGAMVMAIFVSSKIGEVRDDRKYTRNHDGTFTEA